MVRKHVLRDLGRVREIVSVFAKFEMYNLVNDLEFWHHMPWHKRFKKGKHHRTTQPKTVRLIFEELGGTFLKFGQLLALRPDLVGRAYSEEFEKLFDDIEPDPWEDILEEIEKYVPGGIKAFKSINKKALATGSIAQIHVATLYSGKKVAVKVKKPGIDEDFREDISIMEEAARIVVKKYNPVFFDPIGIVEEFKQYTIEELDLLHEQRNMARFKENFKDIKQIKIPESYPELSSSNILVMEFINGKNILDLRGKKINFPVVKYVTNAVYKQLFLDGFFHADLHPGNIYVMPNNKIAFLDFGIVGFVNRSLKKKLKDLFIALIEGNLDKTTKALMMLNVSHYDVDNRVLEEGIYHALSDYYDLPMEKVPVVKILNDLIAVARKAHLQLPSQIVLFTKSLLTLEGFCRELDPKFNVVQSAKPYLKKLMREKLELKSLSKEAFMTSIELKDMILNLPQTAHSLSHKMKVLEERIIDIDNTFHHLSETLWRTGKLTIYSILFAAILISSSYVMTIKPLYYNVSLFAIVGTGISIVILLLIAILLKHRGGEMRKV
jgi:ubiquinone biosynthesis protein